MVIQPKPDLVVQICVLAENLKVKQHMLDNHNINLETVDDILPVKMNNCILRATWDLNQSHNALYL